MEYLASLLVLNGFILRSGAAKGADAAFELGAGRRKEIFLPWDNFEGKIVDNVRFFLVPEKLNHEIDDKWLKWVHPAYDTLLYNSRHGKPFALKAHRRNILQVLGRELVTPSRCVICWTPGGLVSGGTATAIRTAERINIPVFNLAKEGVFDQVSNMIHQELKRF